MQIVIGTHSLAGAGGTETYTVTVADHLQRLGHDVWLHSRELGRASDAADRLGVRVAREEELPAQPDVVLGGDAAVACELALRYPEVAQVFVCHSDAFDLQLPPQLPGLVAAAVVLYDRVDERVRALAEPVPEILRLTQPVDLDRFKPGRPLPARPRVAMSLGNYAHGERVELLRRACRRAGIELRHVGVLGEGERPSDQVLGEADVIFGKARVIVEAMACGRAAYVYDHNGGDGWVTAATYAQLAADNFGGQSFPAPVEEDRLVADLAAYDPAMGLVNRDLAVTHHSAARHAAALAGLLGRVAAGASSRRADAPLAELARMVRLYHRADSQAFSLRAQAEALSVQAHEAHVGERKARELSDVAEARSHALALRVEALEADLAALRADAERTLESARTEAASARSELGGLAESARAREREASAARGEADESAKRLQAVAGSRRWRAVQALMSPWDRLRSRPAGRGSDQRARPRGLEP
jgi:hypothetical protein